MTRAQLAAQLRRAVLELEPALSRAILQSIDDLLARVPESVLASAIATGNVFAVLALFDEALLDTAFAGVRSALTESLRVSVGRTIATLAIPRARELRGVFDVLNPRVIEAVRALDDKVTKALEADVRAMVRGAVERGLVEGVNPRTSARRIRQAVGLGATQEQQVQNFRRALESGDVAKALGYEKRDRRFDRSVRRGDLTREQIDRMVDIYRKRRIALNAESVARTAALDSVKAAQRASWDSAIARGLVDRGRLRKQWVTTLDGRERPLHHELNGTVVGYDEPFPTGDLIPGASEWGCRCVARHFLARD